MNKGAKYLLILGGGLLFPLIAGVDIAFGQGPPQDTLDILLRFQRTDSLIWKERAFQLSSIIFISLVSLQIVLWGYGYITGALKGSGDIAQKLKTLFILYLMIWGVYSLDVIVIAFQQMAIFITGEQIKTNPIAIMIDGIDKTMNVFNVFNDDEEGGWFKRAGGTLLFLATKPHALTYYVAGLGIMFGYIIMALQYAFIVIQTMITFSVGPIAIAFGGFQPLRPIAESYISEVFNLSFKVLFFHILFGFTTVLLQAGGELINESSGFDLFPVMSLGFIAVLSVWLLAKEPARLANAFTKNLTFDFDKLF